MTQLVDRAPAPSPHAPAAAQGAPAAKAAMEELKAPRGVIVPLNAFQLLMRRWSKLHPYNAGQVMRVTGLPDRQRWKQAAETVIGEMGLGKPRFTNGDETAQFVPVDEVVVEIAGRGHAAGTNGNGSAGAVDLQSYFNEELNRPFATGDLPIRFCILPAPRDGLSGESHFFAAVYDHWIADSRAMRELMHRIFERYQYPDGRPGGEGLSAMTVAVPKFNGLFTRHVGRLKRLTAMRESIKNIWKHRHGFRLNLADPLDFSSRFVYRELPEGLIERLYRFAKGRGASVNDLFIAVIAQSTGAYTAHEREHRHRKLMHFERKRVGIGTIVDIRDAAAQPLDRIFNLYLSSYTVLLDKPEKRTADDLTREVAAETCRIKKTMAAVRGYWALVMARFWYDVYESPRYRASLLHKTVPVVAGISNVNMSATWVDPKSNGAAADGLPQVLDYIRISPTGPLIPLVFTLTTVGGRLSLCVTYRKTSFSDVKAAELIADFMGRLEEIGAGEAAK